MTPAVRTPEPSPLPPSLHLGPYRLLRCIAQGGMGEVHLATLEREAGFRKLVAVKRALPHLANDPSVVSRFEREARLAAVLTHRHIVQVFDFGRADGAAWLAMEYVHGVDLKAAQDRLGPQPLPAGLAVEIGLACARGLHHAHGVTDAAGQPLHLVHRDVSPHNVLLSFDGDVKLTDFGLADAATGPEHPDGMIQGKYAYMSPEQARGGAVDARSDQYSLAVVLYELLSGARAFQGLEGPMATMDRVVAGRPLQPLSAFGVAGALVSVVERAMRPAPADRYPDMPAFADALRGAAVGAGIAIGEPPMAEWLAGLFPERGGPAMVPAPMVVHEGTAAADAPIAGRGSPVPGGPIPPSAGFEATLDAVAPAALNLVAPAALNAPVPQDAPAPAGPLDDSLPAPGRVGARRRWAAAAGLLLGGGALIFGLTRSPAPDIPTGPGASASGVVSPGALAVSSAEVSTTPAAVTVAPSSPAATVGSSSPSAAPGAPAAASGSPRGLASAPRPASAPGSVAAVRAAPAGVSSASASRASPPPIASPASAPTAVHPAPPIGSAPSAAATPASAPVAEAAATPAAVSAPAPAADRGPRVRLVADGASVRDEGGAALSTWRALAAGPLFARVVGGAGPPVRLRVLASGRNVRANVTALPYGEVELDGVAMGGTPLADLPLRAGTRRLAVRGPDGSVTRLTIEVGVATESDDGGAGP